MKKRIEKILFIIIIVISALVLYKYINTKFGIAIDCPIHKITKLYCPGCGITRMLFAILNLNFYQAFRYNPLLFITIPFWLFYILDFIISYIKGKKSFFNKHITNKFWLGLAIIFIVFGFIRNIPQFYYLAPTKINTTSEN